jgi:hypothetical protein
LRALDSSRALAAAIQRRADLFKDVKTKEDFDNLWATVKEGPETQEVSSAVEAYDAAVRVAMTRFEGLEDDPKHLQWRRNLIRAPEPEIQQFATDLAKECFPAMRGLCLLGCPLAIWRDSVGMRKESLWRLGSRFSLRKASTVLE